MEVSFLPMAWEADAAIVQPGLEEDPGRRKIPPGASHGRHLVLTPGFVEPLGEEKHHGASRDDASAA